MFQYGKSGKRQRAPMKWPILDANKQKRVKTCKSLLNIYIYIYKMNKYIIEYINIYTQQKYVRIYVHTYINII